MNTIIEDLITKWGITVNPTLLEYIVIMFSFFSLVLVLYLITKLVFRDASSNRTMFVKCALVFIGILVCLSAFAELGCNLIYVTGDTSEPSEPVTPTLKDGYHIFEYVATTSDQFYVPYDGYIIISSDNDGSVEIETPKTIQYDFIAYRTIWISVNAEDFVTINTTGTYTAYIARETPLADAIEP